MEIFSEDVWSCAGLVAGNSFALTTASKAQNILPYISVPGFSHLRTVPLLKLLSRLSDLRWSDTRHWWASASYRRSLLINVSGRLVPASWNRSLWSFPMTGSPQTSSARKPFRHLITAIKHLLLFFLPLNVLGYEDLKVGWVGWWRKVVVVWVGWHWLSHIQQWRCGCKAAPGISMYKQAYKWSTIWHFILLTVNKAEQAPTHLNKWRPTHTNSASGGEPRPRV